MNALAIVAAGGSSRRMGFDKTCGALCGVPLLTRTLQRLAAVEELHELIVAVPAGQEQDVAAACVEPFGLAARTRIVAGGVTRVHSVWHALQAVTTAPDVVAIHDGARPFVSVDVVRASLLAAHQHGGALVALPVVPTIKRVAQGCVLETLDRRELWGAATPQSFRYDAFRHAYEQLWASGVDVTTITDDAQIFERAGGTVMIVESNPENIKLTTPFDWRVAQMLASGAAR